MDIEWMVNGRWQMVKAADLLSDRTTMLLVEGHDQRRRNQGAGASAEAHTGRRR
jgi:hypothetical protein